MTAIAVDYTLKMVYVRCYSGRILIGGADIEVTALPFCVADGGDA